MKFNKKWLWLVIPLLIFSLCWINSSSVSTVLLAIKGTMTDGNLIKFSGTAGIGEDSGISASGIGTGDVLGPATSVDNSITRFNGTNNKTIQDSLATVDDSGSINIPSGQTYKINTSSLAYSDLAGNRDFYNALGSDHLYSGDIDSEPVGETVAFGDLLYFDWTDKEWKIADADSSTTVPGLRIALEAKNNGETCKLLVKGYIRDDSAFEFAGAMVYASATAGDMTSTAPSSAGQQVQRVGVAKSADILFFDPSIDVGEI